jgi:hypothetical protein
LEEAEDGLLQVYTLNPEEMITCHLVVVVMLKTLILYHVFENLVFFTNHVKIITNCHGGR